jgi:hypothetical protein
MAYAETSLLPADIQGVYKRMVRFQKINKKCISHLTRAKRTPSAAATVEVFNALIISVTLWHPNYFSTPCRSNANNTGTKKGSIMK